MERGDIPQGPHYAIMIVKKESVFHEADQRSKDCPGHGYPAHTTEHEVITYKSYADTDVGRAQWEEELKSELFALKMGASYAKERTHIVGFHVDKVARAKMEVDLEIKE